MGPKRSAPQRTAIACESCRIRRIKCDGERPCKACSNAGAQTSCISRSLARPKRARPMAISDKHTSCLQEIENKLHTWAATRGFESNLSLPQIPPLASWTSSMELDEDLAIEQSSSIFPLYLPPIPAEILMRQYQHYRTASPSLPADERALVLSCICLGSCARADNLRVPAAARYWHRARKDLEEVAETTTHSLRALLNLQLFAQRIGGPEDSRDLSEDFANQARRLNKSETPGTHTEMQHLLTMGMYKDSWYATLCDAPPFTDVADFANLTRKADSVGDLPTLDNVPSNLLRLAEVENRILHQIHDGRINTSSIDYVLDCEKELLSALRSDEERNEEISGGFAALTRYHWMRLLLRAPLMDHSTMGPGSVSVVTRAVSTILHTYAHFASLNALFPCWPQIRRITTCGQLLLLVYGLHRELFRSEAETLAILMLNLLKEHENMFNFASDLRHRFESAFTHIGLDVANPILSILHQEKDDSNQDCMFDFSLPSAGFDMSEESLWLWPPVF